MISSDVNDGNGTDWTESFAIGMETQVDERNEQSNDEHDDIDIEHGWLDCTYDNDVDAGEHGRTIGGSEMEVESE
jgi:hypothetical protein